MDILENNEKKLIKAGRLHSTIKSRALCGSQYFSAPQGRSAQWA